FVKRTYRRHAVGVSKGACPFREVFQTSEFQKPEGFWRAFRPFPRDRKWAPGCRGGKPPCKSVFVGTSLQQIKVRRRKPCFLLYSLISSARQPSPCTAVMRTSQISPHRSLSLLTKTGV